MDSYYRVVEDHPEFLVVNKSPGIAIHADTEYDAGDSQGLLALIKSEQKLAELYPVHRLDKVTSGLLVMAKTRDANRALSMQFEQRSIEKYYLALSRRKPKKKQGKISGDMERGRRGSWKLAGSQRNPAVTQFFSTAVLGEGRLFLLKPRTGKTHQLRVALKSIGAPITGDGLYGGEVSDEPADRVYLHAYCLGFVLGGVTFRFVCPPDQGLLFQSSAFHNACDQYGQPWELLWPDLGM